MKKEKLEESRIRKKGKKKQLEKEKITQGKKQQLEKDEITQVLKIRFNDPNSEAELKPQNGFKSNLETIYYLLLPSGINDSVKQWTT